MGMDLNKKGLAALLPKGGPPHGRTTPKEGFSRAVKGKGP